MDTDGSRMRRRLICDLCLSVFVGVSVLGCAHRADKIRKPVVTEPMYDVVKAINANNNRLPTFYATLRTFGTSIVDERGKRDDEVLGGQILYRAPRELRVIGRKE